MNDADLSLLIERCYDAAFDTEAWPDLLQSLAERFCGVGANFRDMRGSAEQLVVSPELVEPAGPYAAHWWRHDTFLKLGQSHFATGLFVESDHLTRDFRDRDPYCQEFQRPHGIGNVIAYVLKTPGGAVLSFNVQRRLGAEPVEAEERRTFAMVGRHLARSATLWQRMTQAETLAASLADRLGAFDCALAVVGAGGRLLRGNALLHALERDGIAVRRNRLVLSRPDDQARLDRFVAALSSAAPGDAARRDLLVLPRPGDVLPLLVRGTALGPEIADRRLVTPEPVVMLVILRPDLPGYPPLEDVLAALGLTRGQARFALAVGGGLTLGQAADLFKVSDETARSMLKQVYARLGINRQSQLARLIAKVAPFER